MSSERVHKQASRYRGMEDVRLEVAIKIGRARCRLKRLGELAAGDVIPLDRRIGEPFELLVGGRLLARVEPVGHPDGIAVKVVEIPEDDDDR